jgi:hypothetical protein
MTKMVLGIFAKRSSAEEAIVALNEAGYSSKDISIVMKDTGEARKVADSTGASVASGAVSGAATGGMLGALTGLLIGIGAITIPGIGAILVGGPLAAALGLSGAAATTVSGAVTGALAGGLVGALVGLGVPEEDARYYEEQIRLGAILVAVPVLDTREDEVRDILDEFGATQVRSVATVSRRRSEMVEEKGGRAAFFSDVKKRR